jgi:hypothetical protein
LASFIISLLDHRRKCGHARIETKGWTGPDDQGNSSVIARSLRNLLTLAGFNQNVDPTVAAILDPKLNNSLKASRRDTTFALEERTQHPLEWPASFRKLLPSRYGGPLTWLIQSETRGRIKKVDAVVASAQGNRIS